MIGVVCAIAILSAGCKSKESEAPTPSSTQDVPAETAETEYQPEPVETHEGEVRSFYTGEWMSTSSGFTVWMRSVERCSFPRANSSSGAIG